MALPTVSHNTPSAGYITWTAFGIQYNGQSFGIPADNSNMKYVWWKYNAGAPALYEGNALPADLTVDDIILFVNKEGIGALIPDAPLFEGSIIVGGSILAQAIGANQIQTTHLQANAVTADIIASNAVVSKHISAGTVTADKLSVGTVSDNMVVNGSFEDNLSGYLVGWMLNSVVNGTIIPVTGASSSGAVSMQMVATTTAANLRFRQLPEQYIPVSAASGRKYYISVRAGASTATTNGHYQRVNWYDANKTFISSNDIRANAALTTTFTLYEGQVTPPATAKYMGMEVIFLNPNVTTTVYIDEISAHEVTMSAQIGDGQITAVKILANSITGDRITAGTIDAAKLLVSDRTNYWENPDFEGDTTGAIPKGTTLTATTYARVLGAGARGSVKSLELNARNDANNDVFSTNIFPVEPGDQYFVQYDYKFLNAAGTASAGVGFRTYNAVKAGITWTGVATTGSARPTTWQINDPATETYNSKTGVYTVPDGTYFLQPWVYFANNAETTNRFHVDNIIIRRMHEGELLVDGSITADKLETELVLATKIIAGDPDGTHAEMSNQGFKVYAADPSDNIPNEVVRLGVASTDDYFAVTRADGSLAATISQDGVGSFSQVSANEELYYKGEKLSDLLDGLPRGPLYKAELSGNPIDNITTAYGLVEGSFLIDADRQVQVQIGIKTYPTGETTEMYMHLYYTVDGTAPSINSAKLLDGVPLGVVSSTTFDYKEFTHTIRPTSFLADPLGKTMRILLAVYKGNGNRLHIMPGLQTYMYLTDVGKGIPHTANHNSGGGSNPTPQPPAPPVVTYVKQYGCTNSANYDGNGNRYTMNDSVMYQGLSPAGYGNLKSIGLFNDMTADLSGASINYVRVIFDFQHWYYNSGGTARIGVHGHTGIPGTDWGRGPLSAISTGWPKPGARWVELSSSHWDGFRTGAYKGVYLEGDSTYTTYGYSVRPTIEISYTK